MGDIKPELFTRSVRKHAGRAKERILQNLGKADRTTDEVFDDYVHNFSRQQGQAQRLQKEMANYVRCARAMQAANKSLMDTIYDMYEPEWADRERLERQARELELLWADYCHKLSDQVLEPLNTYSSQFPEVRRKVEKRGRKLVDYDSHRHNYEALQNNTKKRDQTKITRQHEVLEEARRTFELMNNELYDELPALYDSRIPFLVSNMQTMFMAEHNFQSEAAKVQLDLEAVMEGLQKDSSSGKYTTRRNAPKSPKSPTAPTPASPTNKSVSKEDPRPYEEISYKKENGDHNGEVPPVSGLTRLSSEASRPVNGGTKVRPEELYDIPVGASTDNLPPGVLYQVKAAYKYQAEDADELSFEVAEIIQVVEYDDDEEMEEGWLMGQKESTGQKGLFPANFTRPI